MYVVSPQSRRRYEGRGEGGDRSPSPRRSFHRPIEGRRSSHPQLHTWQVGTSHYYGIRTNIHTNTTFKKKIGKDVYGEKRISVDGPPGADGNPLKLEYRHSYIHTYLHTYIEPIQQAQQRTFTAYISKHLHIFRVWNPFRSKLAAAILGIRKKQFDMYSYKHTYIHTYIQININTHLILYMCKYRWRGQYPHGPWFEGAVHRSGRRNHSVTCQRHRWSAHTFIH